MLFAQRLPYSSLQHNISLKNGARNEKTKSWIDSRIWILNQAATKIKWIANQLTPHLNFESIDIGWQPNQLNFIFLCKRHLGHVPWLHLKFSLCATSGSRPGAGGGRTAASCQHRTWRPSAIPPTPQTPLKSVEFHTKWQPNHLNPNQLTAKIIWISIQMIIKSL